MITMGNSYKMLQCNDQKQVDKRTTSTAHNITTTTDQENDLVISDTNN